MALAACARTDDAAKAPPAHRGPVVLVTFEGLRADAVGGLGSPPGGGESFGGQTTVTPNLDRLIAEAWWAGTGIAASSDSLPALASLLTGLQPWTHGVIAPERAVLAEPVTTLAEAMKRAGYETRGFLFDRQGRERLGFTQGLDQVADLVPFDRVTAELASLSNRPTFWWLDLRLPTAPYRRFDEVAEALGWLPDELPQLVTARGLTEVTDPGVPWTEDQRWVYRALYLMNVARADRQLGVLLDALRQNQGWDDTLLVVTSSRGEELGEYGLSMGGGSLGRVLIEVPLVIRWPRARLAHAPAKTGKTEPLAAAAIFATLVKAVGGEPAPATAPALGSRSTSRVLSELYMIDGGHEISWYRDGLQVIRRNRLAAPDPGFYRARALVDTGAGGRAAQRAHAELAALREKLERISPFPGLDDPEVRAWQWTEDRGLAVLNDAALVGQLGAELEAAWRQSHPDDLPLRPPRLPVAPIVR